MHFTPYPNTSHPRSFVVMLDYSRGRNLRAEIHWGRGKCYVRDLMIDICLIKNIAAGA